MSDHTCDEHDTLYSSVAYKIVQNSNGIWYMSTEEGDMIAIRFCPSCGFKLVLGELANKSWCPIHSVWYDPICPHCGVN